MLPVALRLLEHSFPNEWNERIEVDFQSLQNVPPGVYSWLFSNGNYNLWAQSLLFYFKIIGLKKYFLRKSVEDSVLHLFAWDFEKEFCAFQNSWYISDYYLSLREFCTLNFLANFCDHSGFISKIDINLSKFGEKY